MRLELSAVGLASVRYGVSPLFELAALLRRLRRGSRGALAAGVWGDWSAQYKGLYSDPDASTVLRLLGGRVGSLTWVAGTPSMGRSFAEDLDALRDLTDADLVADVERTAPDLLPGLELGHFRRQVEAGMVRMWRVLLEPVWPAVRAVAEHEVSRATAVLQRLGWNGVFDTVCRGVSWDGHGLELSGLDQVNPGVESRGGLVLMPSVFVMDGPVVRLDPVGSPTLAFPARGVGHLFSAEATVSNPLAGLLGANRARILVALQTPTTVTHLRDLFGLSLGSLSRHLSVLVDSRLVSSRRVGRTVEYQLTDVGRSLVCAQPTDQSTDQTSDREPDGP